MTEYPECQDCGGWCCASFDIISRVTTEEIERIAEHLEIPYKRFFDEFTIDMPYVAVVPEDPAEPRCFKFTRPCLFWTQGRCGINAVKPAGCANFVPRTRTDHIGNVAIKETCSAKYRGYMTDARTIAWWEWQKETKSAINTR